MIYLILQANGELAIRKHKPKGSYIQCIPVAPSVNNAKVLQRAAEYADVGFDYRGQYY